MTDSALTVIYSDALIVAGQQANQFAAQNGGPDAGTITGMVSNSLRGSDTGWLIPNSRSGLPSPAPRLHSTFLMP